MTLREFLMCLGVAVVVAAAYLMATSEPTTPERGPFGDSPAVTTEVSYPRQSLPRSVP